tara:strand:+ start:874 stop:1002 length:129 start_codon:yes stop_codon:yes gene_type:complete
LTLEAYLLGAYPAPGKISGSSQHMLPAAGRGPPGTTGSSHYD